MRVKILEEENATLKARMKSQESELSQKCSEVKNSVSENKRLREELEKDDFLIEDSKGKKERKREIEIIDVSF